MARTPAAALAVLALAVAAGCGGDDAPAPDRSPGSLTVTSPAFAPGATIPARFTCAGDGERPALDVAGVSAAARSLAVTVEDPDAPGGTFTHWVVVGLPARTTHVAGAGLPPGAHELRAWRPPCPPKGDAPHRYVFTVSALDTALGAHADPDAIAAHAIAHGTLTGRFGR